MTNYNSQLQSNNIDLQKVLQTLQNKATGTTLPELTNEGSASDLLNGEQLIDSKGKVVVGTMPNNGIITSTIDGIDVKSITIPEGYTSGGTVSLDDTIDNEVDTQADLIAQIASVLENKAAGGEVEQATPVISVNSSGLITATAGDKYATKQLTTQVAITITPSTSSQTAVEKDVYTTGVITVGAIPSEYVVPSGTLPITSNGTYDVKNYASATVNIESSGGGSGEDTEILDDLVSGSITSYSNDTATTVRDGLFMRCTKLTTASFPAATKINQYAFYQCSNLTTVSFPACTSIGDKAFGLCSNIVNVNLPVCATVGMSAFGSCYKLVSLSLPQCTSIANYAIARCSVITSLDLPVCKTIGVSAFRECPKLSTVSMPAVTSIPAGVFSKCFNLKSLYLTGSTLCTLANSNAFASTPIGGYSASAKAYGSIYVPASMLASYQAATNWTYFSNRMVGI